MTRRLRISASVFFALVAIALCVLWVRSYWRADVVTAAGDGSQQIGSARGWLTIRWNEPRFPATRVTGWGIVSISAEEREEMFKRWDQSRYTGVPPEPFRSTFFRLRTVISGMARFHYWLPTLVFALLAVVPWIRLRFSLRTMLIATTLVAVVLGLAVWAAK